MIRPTVVNLNFVEYKQGLVYYTFTANSDMYLKL